MKRVFYAFLLLFAICALPAATFAANHKMEIVTDKDTVEVGETFKVSVVVTLDPA